MKLEVMERMMLLNILPREGDFTTLKLVRKLRETLSFNEKEIAQIDFMNHWKCPVDGEIEIASSTPKCPKCEAYMVMAGQVTWDERKAESVVKDIHIGGRMFVMCQNELQKLSDTKKLTQLHMSLFEKFEGEDSKEEGE